MRFFHDLSEPCSLSPITRLVPWWVRSLPAKLKKIERVLDVAAGSAAWSLPFAQALPNGRVTVVDYAEVTGD